MSTSILPPLPTAEAAPSVDLDSLAARQARNTQQTVDANIAFRQTKRAALSAFYSQAWGRPKKVRQGDGTLVEDLSVRLNENNLTPQQVWEGYGTQGVVCLQAFVLEVSAAAQFDPTVTTHATTGEDMTTCPAGWTLTPQEDNTVVAAYAAPVEN